MVGMHVNTVCQSSVQNDSAWKNLIAQSFSVMHAHDCIICGKHNPVAYFWHALKQERDHLTEAETILQLIIYNELLLRKPTWDKDALDCLSLNKHSMTGWTRVRTQAQDQEIIDHRALLKRSAKSTACREWKVVAEHYMA
eukprot:1586108-Rhodomonas_salina.5